MNIFKRVWQAVRTTERSAEIKKEDTTLKGTTFGGNKYERNLYQQFYVDNDYRSKLALISRMDQEDGRVKQIHSKLARDATRGGMSFTMSEGEENEQMKSEADALVKRCGLDNREKLKAHARFLAKDGELVLNWVVDKALNVVGCRRLPPSSIKPNVDDKGQFRSLKKAYIQYEPGTTKELASFAFWEISHIKLEANPDDPGERGRPWCDGERVRWKKLAMTEEDLVIRRRDRATDRKLHTLEGATWDDIEKYKLENKDALENMQIQTDYYTNKKGGVTSITGDANLDQIKDIDKILDDFFVGNAFPSPLIGYLNEINRDVFEDALKGYYEILEEFQEILADGYEEGVRLQFLLKGINADGYVWDMKFKGRKVESPTQLTDRMLKHKVMGIPKSIIWEKLGYSVEKVKQAREKEAEEDDPYRDMFEDEIGDESKITNVQGNARNKESAVSIGNK